MLLNFIVGLYAVDLNENIFRNYENFKEVYSIFEDDSEELCRVEFNGVSLDPFYYFPRFLFSNIDLKNKTQISIYDPACGSGINVGAPEIEVMEMSFALTSEIVTVFTYKLPLLIFGTIANE